MLNCIGCLERPLEMRIEIQHKSCPLLGLDRSNCDGEYDIFY